MRTLILMRHAKSDWGEPSLSDHDRPLSGRGRRAAPAMGRWLASKDLMPDRVDCSSALRTRETWERVAEEIDRPVDLHVDHDLYLAGPGSILVHIQGTPASVATLMVLGHNPGMHALASALSGSGARGGGGGAELDLGFPTGAVAVLGFQGSWDEVRPGEGSLEHFVRPKDLPDAESLRL